MPDKWTVAWSDGEWAGDPHMVDVLQGSCADQNDPTDVLGAMLQWSEDAGTIGGDVPATWVALHQGWPPVMDRQFMDQGNRGIFTIIEQGTEQCELRNDMSDFTVADAEGKAKAQVAADLAARLGPVYDAWLFRDEPLVGATEGYITRDSHGRYSLVTQSELDELRTRNPDVEVAPAGSDAALAMLREKAVSKLINIWARNDRETLPLQEVIWQEFELEGTAGRGLSPELEKVYADNLPLYQGFIRAMYQATQEDLESRGITALAVYRGLTSDEWGGGLKNLANIEDPYWGGEAVVWLDAAESWTITDDIATRFADPEPRHRRKGTVISALVPASRVLATPFSGFGCMDEHEVVVLGGTEKVDVGSIYEEEEEEEEADEDDNEEEEQE